jgi:phage-related holin
MKLASQLPIDKLDLTSVSVGSVVTFLIGPLSYKLLYMLIVIIADTITGIRVAVKNDDFNLKLFIYKSYNKFLNYITFLVMSHAIDEVMSLGGNARWIAISGVVSVEFSSFARNMKDLGNQSITKCARNIFAQINSNSNVNLDKKGNSNQSSNDGDENSDE